MSATATTLTIEWTHPGDGGSPLTRNFIEYRVEGTTDWTNWYRGETPTPVTRAVIRNLAAETAYDVRVHSRNAIGNSQWAQSATAFSTLAGNAATGAPTISGTLHVGRTQTASPGTIADADDLTNASYSYQWVRVDADGTSNEEDITDETDATYTLTADDLGKKVKVEVRFVDILGGKETRTSAATATLAGVPNTAATGAPTITGTAQVGETLTASTTGIADADGLTSPTYTYQWIRVDGTEADIAGENSSTYTLVDADLGKTLKVKVTFDDDASHTEMLTSAATATVTAAATAALGQVMGVGVAPGQRAAGGDLDGGGHRHGLHGAVDVGQPGLHHRRPAGHGHDGGDHTLHDSQPHQRHGIHGAGDRDPDGRHRRPALGGDDRDARHHARRAAGSAGGAGRRAGDAALGRPGE